MRIPSPAGQALDVMALDVNLPAGGGLLFSRPCWLLGWLLNAGALSGTQPVTLYDGSTAAGNPIGTLVLTVGMHDYHHPAQAGVPLDAGLFIATPSPLTGSVFLGTP